MSNAIGGDRISPHRRDSTNNKAYTVSAPRNIPNPVPSILFFIFYHLNFYPSKLLN